MQRHTLPCECPVIAVHCRRGVIQCCQQVCLDIPYLCGVPVDTAKDILKVAGIELQKPAPHHLPWEIVSCNEQHGYLTRRRIRFENGRLGDIEYMIHEKPVSGEPEGDSPERENPEQVKPIQAKPKQGEPKQEEPGQGKPAQLNTDSSNTDRLNTHQSISAPPFHPSAVPHTVPLKYCTQHSHE